MQYDVYVYVDTEHINSSQIIMLDDSVNAAMSIPVTDNVDDIHDGSGTPLPFIIPNDYDDATFDAMGTYVVFRNLSGPTFTLQATSMVDNPAYINGFQIAGFRAVVPEPSTLILCVLGCVSVIALRGKRKQS